MNKWKPRSSCLRERAHSFKVVPRSGSHQLKKPRRPWGRSAGRGHYLTRNLDEVHSGQVVRTSVGDQKSDNEEHGDG